METGITQKEATEKLKQYGFNEIRDVSKKTYLSILFGQIKNNFIIYLLLIAVGISFFVGETPTAYTILLVIFLVIITGFIQEYRAEQSISALKKMLLPTSIVVREGREQRIESKFIVPDDVVILHAGERIPADCIVLEENELRVDESILTGESLDVKKIPVEDKEVTDENLIFMGTYVVNGKCRVRVLHTGMNTKFGNIALLISTSEKELPLQKKVNALVKYMAILGSSVSVLVGIIMFFQTEIISISTVVNILIVVIAISVSSFPEGFPVVLITALGVGSSRMAKQNAIVNKMSIIETLGETTVICTDKTGTITKGEMTVKKIYIDDDFITVDGVGYNAVGSFSQNGKKINIKNNPLLHSLFINALVCNDAFLERSEEGSEFKKNGSATEAALLVLGAKAGLFSSDTNHNRIEEIPFNSERKFMGVLCSHENKKIAYIKGAPEYIVEKCNAVEKKNGIVKLTIAEKKKIIEASNTMACESLRTIAFAYRKITQTSKNIFEERFIFVGVAGMEDAPRDEVKEAIKICRSAGIQVKMITGDKKETAVAIGKEIGLEGEVMEGSILDSISDAELAERIKLITIFSRVRPEHKLRIVKALKANGEIVMMTGDGVNDAPALKEAHIGVAMGKNGTDVSRSVADLILKDDNFNTIVLAIKEGRTIFKNIRKFVAYQFSCNFAELSILFFSTLFAPMLGWQTPLLVALQILFMNLVTDDLPSITLALNPSSKDAMNEFPRKNRNILDKKVIILIVFSGILLMIFTLLSYFIAYNLLGRSYDYARTVALFSLILLEIVAAFNFRSLRKKVLGRSLLINRALFFASLISLCATLVIIYSPLSKIFSTVPIGFDAFFIAGLFSLFIVIIFDVLKKINAKRKFFDFEHI